MYQKVYCFAGLPLCLVTRCADTDIQGDLPNTQELEEPADSNTNATRNLILQPTRGNHGHSGAYLITPPTIPL
jgi:hypothetical protein